MNHFKPTDRQYKALTQVKKQMGRYWKSKLLLAWESGKYPSSIIAYRAELQKIRNSGGPSWLKTFKLN